MKILLISPKYDFADYTPSGLASIASVAEQLGHEVLIVDLNISGAKLPKSKYDLVGISGLSLWKNSIINVSKTFIDSPVIVGGPWASLYPRDALSYDSIDYVCMGEGEETFREFLQCYPDVRNVKGIGYKENGIKLNDPRPFIQNLDALPTPAWHLIDLPKYTRVSVVTSRGCPFNCIFCSDHTLLGRKWRPRSVESVVSEIELLVNRYGVKHITFGDENMTLEPERFEQICETIIDRDIHVEFDAIQGVRADRLTPRLLELMKKSGFTEIIIAPESGCQRVLDEVIHKSLDLSVVEPVVKKCKEIDLTCSAFFVIGFPWETSEEIQETVSFANHLRSVGLSSAYIGNALPFPDTELYTKAKEEGFLRFDGEELEEILYYLGKPRNIHCLTSPYWKPEDIIKICKCEEKKNLLNVYRKYSLGDVARKFLRHPVRSLRKVVHVIK